MIPPPIAASSAPPSASMEPPTLLRRVAPESVGERRGRPVDAETLAHASRILADIEARGDEAAIEHAVRLGDLSPGRADRGLVHTRGALTAARDALGASAKALLERTAGGIESFARAQRACVTDLRLPVGVGARSAPVGEAGHTWLPVETAGCYSPSGRFPLVSSVLMTVIPARVAGVASVWVATPRASQEILAAACIAGADGVLELGGVQGIAALADGLCGAPACDVIVGPGNRWVTAAKFLVSARVGIDSLAGPSELVVIADDAADASLVAADLLAQAEHDPDASAILITTSARLHDRVEVSLRSQLEDLPTAAIARESLTTNGASIVVGSIEEAIRVSDHIGPEHLHLAMEDAAANAAHPRVRNAGAVFIGGRCGEVFGDYGIGPNHVLPTGGASRYRAGLSVLSFLRARTWLNMTGGMSREFDPRDVVDLARMEGLEGHARSALSRGEPR